MKQFFKPLGIATIVGFALIACNFKTNTESTATEGVPSIPVVETAAPADTGKTAVAKDDTVTIVTSKGNIIVRLYKETKLHHDNFLKLCRSGFYNGVLFHRVINGFMIQTGDPNSKAATPGAMYGNGGPGYTIPAEILPAFRHKKGALAAARMGDEMNPNRESSGSQFYICHGAPSFLDLQYTVFGETIEGLNIVDMIATVACDPNDRPLSDIKIISTSVKGDAAATPEKKAVTKPDTAKTKSKGKTSKK